MGIFVVVVPFFALDVRKEKRAQRNRALLRSGDGFVDAGGEGGGRS